MASWFACLGWLIKRQQSGRGFEPGITASNRLAPGSRFYAVYAGGIQVGTASFTADTLADGARVEQRLDIGTRDSIESYLETVTLTPTLTLRGWTARATGLAPSIVVEGSRDSNGVFRAQLRTGTRTVRSIRIADARALPVLAAALRISVYGLLVPRDTISLDLLDPLSGAVHRARFVSVPPTGPLIVVDSARLDRASGQWVPALTDTIQARLLVELGSSAPIMLWLDPAGFPLRAQLPNGLLLERTAFEIAHLNFRNGARPTITEELHRFPPALPDLLMAEDTAETLDFPAEDPAISARTAGAFRGATSRADSVSGLARWVSRRIGGDGQDDDAIATLASRRGSELGRARLFIATLRHHHIPARLTLGARRDSSGWSPVLLPQVFLEHWLAADLNTGRVQADSTLHIVRARSGGGPIQYRGLLASLERLPQ